MTAPASARACHAEIHRRLFNAFEFQLPIERRTSARVVVGCIGVDPVKQALHRPLGPSSTDDDKIPRLHEPHRPGMMRRIEQSSDDLLWDRIRQKVSTHVPAFKNRPIHRRSLGLRELPPRLDSPFGHARGLGH